MTTQEIEYASYAELVQRGIKYKTGREYPFGRGEYPVYTYKVYCNDGTIWGYSSEDDIFIQE
jgi:hypothetical protein